MHLLASYLFIFCLALGAACGSGNASKKNADSVESAFQEENLQQESFQQSSSKIKKREATVKGDTLYRISGTEPFWSLVVAKPQIIFTSMGGDTLKFNYQEPRQAAARPEGYLQVYNLGEQQQLILRQANQCPCSDGMSDKEYPYQAVLILKDRVMEGCGRTP